MNIQMTTHELLNFLSELRCCTAVSFITNTDADLLKTGNPYPNVRKIQTVRGLIGCSYENRVLNQQGREDVAMDFVVQPRKWGTRMDNKILIEHIKKGETLLRHYIELHCQDRAKGSDKPIYVNGDTLEVIETEALRQWIKSHSAPKTQDSIEKKVIIRDFELCNIKRMKIFGDILSIENDEILASVPQVKERVNAYDGEPIEV